MEDEERLQLGPNADWMSRLPVALHDVPLWDLAIPGSHDSMSFCLDLSSPVLGSEPRLLRVTDRLAPCWTRPCVSRWATTQAVWTETLLSSGKQTHREMIVQDLIALILDGAPEVSDCVQEAPTLRSCWSRRQQLVVSYDDQRMALQYPQLWTGIPYWYADSSDPKKVISYLEAMKCSGRPATFYVCGLNLTENAAYVLLHPLQSMKTMTRRALSLLLRWASRQRPGDQAGGVNVLCCDFVGGSQFCSLVIGLNYKLLDPVRVETG
ncbi:hypothetical protein fugu_002190 [Takifugu bimaculatus]|uniref:Phosphatidylinositol-specific phospholipase C X domain-containing protein n=1 Tax=Takifugu bimaculatus TaxID=433685 RepID=A0A4Z2BP03_9TELE|nr:hypothetical protein fugu_002190 [Takifugu bimaculatus]